MASPIEWIAYRDSVERLNEAALATAAMDLLPSRDEPPITLVGDAARIRAALAEAGLAGRIIDMGSAR